MSSSARANIDEPESSEQALRVLLVEDNPAHAELVELLLTAGPRELECTWKQTLAEAVREAEADNIAVVLLDLLLPDSDNPTNTLEVMFEAARGAPIVVLTSVHDEALGRDAVKRGAQDFLVKGNISAELLRRTLDYAIERKRYAAEIERSNRELQHFAYVVAHELRSPLSAMILSLDLMLQKQGLAAELQETLNGFRESSQEMAAFLSELLGFATVSCDFDVEPVDCGELVNEVLRNSQAELARSGAQVVVHPLPRLLTARTILRHVLHNLINNAVKYRAEGRPPRVEVSAERRGDFWALSVRDNGSGMDPADAQRVFQMFARGRQRERRAVGFGIGLAFCKQAVERLGGAMQVESVLGEGSTFSFTVPANEGDVGRPSAAAAAPFGSSQA